MRLFSVLLIPLFPLTAKSKPRHLPHYNDVRYYCAGQKTIEARFFLGEKGKVKLKLSDGRKFELPQAEAASGVRYANDKATIEFWTKGEEAFFVEKEEITYNECVAR